MLMPESVSGFLVEKDKLSFATIVSEGELFKEDIEIKITTQGDELVISPNVDYGYGPELFIGNFLNNGFDQLLYSVGSGGSGGYSFYQLFSLKGGQTKTLFDSQDFSPVISASHQIDDVIKIDYQGKLLYLDSSNSGCKNKDDCSLQISSVNAILPYYNIELGRYYLQVLQRIYGGYQANTFGYITTLLEVNSDGVHTVNIGTLRNFEY